MFLGGCCAGLCVIRISFFTTVRSAEGILRVNFTTLTRRAVLHVNTPPHQFAMTEISARDGHTLHKHH